jgi:predicted nucleic acid-binding protein
MNAVVDSSALIHLFTVDPPDGGLADRLSDVVPHVPDIADIEFHHALRGLVIGGKIRPDRASQARRLFVDTPKLRFPSHALVERIWSLRDNFGVYDACFIALAEALHMPLLTCDAKQRAADLHEATVEVF